MRRIIVRPCMRIPLGKQGENHAAQVIWQGIAADYAALYGQGTFTLTVRRCGDAAAYPVNVTVREGDVVWDVRAADTARAGNGSCELTYTVDGITAKSRTWDTCVAESVSGSGTAEPPEDPAKAWFAAVETQIGDLNDLTTKAQDSLVAAINEAAKSGGGGTDVALGLTGAAAGCSPIVKTADADGKPTEWESAALARADGSNLPGFVPVFRIYAGANTQGKLMAYRDKECTVAADARDAAHLGGDSDIQLVWGTKIYRLAGTSASPLRGYFSRTEVTGGGDGALVLRADYATWAPEEYAAGTADAPIAMKRYQAEVMPGAGDVNGDGLVDKIDALMIRAYTRSQLTLSEAALARADYNGDGLVNAADTLAIMEKVNSGEA